MRNPARAESLCASLAQLRLNPKSLLNAFRFTVVRLHCCLLSRSISPPCPCGYQSHFPPWSGLSHTLSRPSRLVSHAAFACALSRCNPLPSQLEKVLYPHYLRIYSLCVVTPSIHFFDIKETRLTVKLNHLEN